MRFYENRLKTKHRSLRIQIEFGLNVYMQLQQGKEVHVFSEMYAKTLLQFGTHCLTQCMIYKEIQVQYRATPMYIPWMTQKTLQSRARPEQKYKDTIKDVLLLVSLFLFSFLIYFLILCFFTNGFILLLFLLRWFVFFMN